jgi:hypothetical protein
VDLPLLCEVAHEDLRRRLEFVRDDVEVPVPVDVEDHRRAGGERAENRDLPGLTLAGWSPLTLRVAVEVEEGS